MLRKAQKFLLSIPCDKTFPWAPFFLTLWPWPWILTHFFKNFNLAINFWTVSANLINLLSISCVKAFPWVPLFFYPVTLTLEFYPFFENFNLANNFWSGSARALIFHRNILWDKTFSLEPIILTLSPWP